MDTYYIMPTVMLCHGTERANSKEEAISKFMTGIDHDINKLIYADLNFKKHKGLRGYFPPKNDFEILMTCIIESMRDKPNRLYELKSAIKDMTAADINILIHLQSAYEYAKQNGTLTDETIRLFKTIAISSISIDIIKHDIPKIALSCKDWKEGAVTAIMSEDIPFDITDEGNIMCKTQHIEAIRKALKGVDVHVRKIG